MPTTHGKSPITSKTTKEHDERPSRDDGEDDDEDNGALSPLEISQNRDKQIEYEQRRQQQMQNDKKRRN